MKRWDSVYVLTAITKWWIYFCSRKCDAKRSTKVKFIQKSNSSACQLELESKSSPPSIVKTKSAKKEKTQVIAATSEITQQQIELSNDTTKSPVVRRKRKSSIIAISEKQKPSLAAREDFTLHTDYDKQILLNGDEKSADIKLKKVIITDEVTVYLEKSFWTHSVKFSKVIKV